MITECAAASPSDRNTIMLHDFHGRASDVAADATAFPARSDHDNIQIVATWDPADGQARTRGEAWVRRCRDVLGPFGDPGSYPAVLAPEDHDRARAFYGPALDRLRRVKADVDPENRFSADFGLFPTPAREAA